MTFKKNYLLTGIIKEEIRYSDIETVDDQVE